jgi:hypothetical protein
MSSRRANATALSRTNRKFGRKQNGVYSNYGANDNPPDHVFLADDVENDGKHDVEVAVINSGLDTNLPNPSNAPTDRLQLEYTNFVPQNLRLNWSSTLGNIGDIYDQHSDANLFNLAGENDIFKPSFGNPNSSDQPQDSENERQHFEDVNPMPRKGGKGGAKGGANGSDERQDYYMMSVKILDRARWNQKIREYIERTRIPPLAEESTNINEPLTPPRDLYEELLTDIINDGRIVSVRYVDLPDNAARFSVQNVPGIRVWDERPASQDADTSQGTEENTMQPSGSEETFGVAETSEKVEEPLEEIQQPAEAAAAAAAPEPEEIPEKFREAREIFFGMPETFLVLVGCEYDSKLTTIQDERKVINGTEQRRSKFFNFYIRYFSKRFNGVQGGNPHLFPRTFLALEWLIIDLCNIMSGNVILDFPTHGLVWNEKIHYPQWEEIMKFPEDENHNENKKICPKMPPLENRLKRITHVRHELFHDETNKNNEIELLLKFFENQDYVPLLSSLTTLFVDFFKIVLLFLGGEWRDLISGTYEKIPYTESPTNDRKNKGETIGLKLNSIKTQLDNTIEESTKILGYDFEKNLYDMSYGKRSGLKSKNNLRDLFGYVNEILTEIVSPFSLLRKRNS